MSSISRSSKTRWSRHEDEVLIDGLQTRNVLFEIAERLPNRSAAIVRRAQQKGYSARLELSGDKSFSFGVKTRTRVKKEVSDEVRSLQTETKSDEASSDIKKTVVDIVPNGTFTNAALTHGDREEFERAMDTLEAADYPVDICAVTILANLSKSHIERR